MEQSCNKSVLTELLVTRKFAGRNRERFVDDGYELSLGDKTILFLHTPGHTKGTLSLFYYDTDEENTYRLGTFGGAGINTLVDPKTFDFEGCQEAYFASIDRLMNEKVDIFIGNHTWNNDTYGKYIKLTETGENDFIDSELWQKFLNTCKEGLEKKITKNF